MAESKLLARIVMDGKNAINKVYEKLKAEVNMVIRSSRDTRAKEDLIVKYIETKNLNELNNIEDIMDSFCSFARDEKAKDIEELIASENLKPERARIFILNAINKGYVTNRGTEINAFMPPLSGRKGYNEKKDKILFKIQRLADIYLGI